jgi:serine/threonine-protein kinase RsbW
MHPRGPEEWGRAGDIDLGAQEKTRRAVLEELGELRPLSDDLQDWMLVLGYPRKDLFAVKLALEEAVVNAFRHGTRGEPGKVVRVNYLATLAEVFVEVDDDGAGFDPAAVPDPRTVGSDARVTQRGLFLMRFYMTGVCFNRQGNRVMLWRRRSEH